MHAPDDPDPLLRTAARFAAHPDFPLAVRTYATGLARFREAPRLVNMVVSTDVRWRIVGYLNYLDADRERFGPEGGATYGRLLDLSTRHGEATPRTVRSLLALLQVSGLVRRTVGRADRRQIFYHPTERMRAFVRDWLRYATAALDVLEPDMRRGSLVGDPRFAEAFAVSGGRAHLEDPIPLADRVPTPLSSLRAMLGSYSVILAVLQARIEGTATPGSRRIAGRFGLSRSQVDRVVQAGLQRGLFVSDEEGRPVPTAALEESFRRWISIELAFYARHLRPPPRAATGPAPAVAEGDVPA